MDSHLLFKFGISDASLSDSPSQQDSPSVSSTYLKFFNIKKSPNSPFVSHCDSDSLTALSEGNIKRNSSTDNFPQVCPSGNSTSSYFQRSSPSVENSGDSLLPSSGDIGLLLNEICGSGIKYSFQELETVLMGPNNGGEEDIGRPHTGGNSDRLTGVETSTAWNQEQQQPGMFQPQTSIPVRHWQSNEVTHIARRCGEFEEKWLQNIPPGNLKQLLIACAKALSDNDMEIFDKLIEKARNSVSIRGEPIERLGAYMIEALIARKNVSGTNIYRALRCREPESKDLLSYMQILYEICPYLKFGYMAANGAIAEACRNEERIHIVDFQIAQGAQWITLLQALAAKPGGPPYVRITGIDDPVSKYARGAGLEAVERRLALISEKFKIPVEFHGVPVFAPDVTKEMLDVRPGEALAVNFSLQLHHTPDESVDVNNPRDALLRMVKSLSPKVTTLVEQESNTNTAPFLTRFIETLEYYLAMFESIDTTMPRDRKERINVEQNCLARDMVNVVACEGKERVERHELFGKWKSRFTMAGFRQYPLSSYVNAVIRGLLRSYSEHYTLVEKDGAMLLGWKGRNLISASAWR